MSKNRTKIKNPGFVVPEAERAEFRSFIQRANRRIKSNLDYIKEEKIKDQNLRQVLAFDFTRKKAWETVKNPLSSSFKFNSEKEYREFREFMSKWGAVSDKRGDYATSPANLLEDAKTRIIKHLNGIYRNNDISLEKYGGNFPPEVMKFLNEMSLEQAYKFFDYVDASGEDEFNYSDNLSLDKIENVTEYVESRIAVLKKFYPKPTKNPKKSRRKTKGRKKK